MKYAQHFDVRILSPKEMKVCSSRTIEVVLRPQTSVKDFKSVKSMLSKDDVRWTQQLLKQLESQMEVFWKGKKNLKTMGNGTSPTPMFRVGDFETHRATTVHFDGGGRATWVGVAVDLDVLEFHQMLRKVIVPVIDEFPKKDLRIDLREFMPDQQRIILEACASLLVLSTYQRPTFGRRAGAQEKGKRPRRTVEFCTQIHFDDAKACMDRGAVLAEGNNLVRHLAELPSNILNPETYRRKVQERARSHKYQFEFYDVPRLKRLKAGALLSVLAGDPHDRGGVAHISWRPKGKVLGTVCLVGKGLCFDTGGHNIKTGHYMYSMHRDMTGSAVALALFEVLQELNLPLEVHGFLALAENMVSPHAYRPNDVVTAMNGVSIEVVDTDAEGRMALADTLALASLQDPHLMIDFATLTGAAVRAVGTARSAVFSNRPSMLGMATECGEASGERVWGFPIGQEYNDALKSQYADVIQCAKGPSPDHILAATFLARFVSEKSTWIHCDLACEENAGGLGLVTGDVTGFGIRWGLRVIERFFMKNS